MAITIKSIQEYIADTLSLGIKSVAAVVNLLDEGATVPFISRYRKEHTGNLNEVEVENIKVQLQKGKEIEKRKATMLETISSLGKLTSELENAIVSCWELNVLEDLYLPYKPKRKTKATVARELGLEPLANWLLQERNFNPETEAENYVKGDVKDVEAALQGARDILAEIINEDRRARDIVRDQFARFALIESKVVKSKEAEAIKYKDYFKFSETLAKCPSHRVLALFRAEEEGCLKLSIGPDAEKTTDRLIRLFIHKDNDCSRQIYLALKDSYKRLIAPSIETEIRQSVKERADAAAIQVFAENLRQLLLSPPLGVKRILALDPGYRTGCKLVCLSAEGALLHHDVIYPHEPQKEKGKAEDKLKQLVEKFKIETVAIGNGTAGRETEEFVKNINFAVPVEVYLVNESGASVYSASEIAREEFPDVDLTVRGAVSIGRRLSDPLAELVKIDPKSIGVGQYQHDVNQTALKESLDSIVLSCVNKVGVNLNTASKSLLTYVSGLGPVLAQNIVQYREHNGAFKSREELKKVPRLGEKAFEQCAGFLRIQDGTNPLDNSAVHPECYDIVNKIASDLNCSVSELIRESSYRARIETEKYITQNVGLLTLQDIMEELAKPGRDPRGPLTQFEFANVKKPEDLSVGMVVPGIVTNITNFGCFVDVGVKQDGLVHISQLADKFIKDPNEVVKLGQHIKVKVIELDLARNRINLSMKAI